jgi:hypothetical protein
MRSRGMGGRARAKLDEYLYNNNNTIIIVIKAQEIIVIS